MIAALDELLGRPVSLRAIAVLRVLVGPVVLLHLRPMLSDSLHGETYRDAFHESYADWYPQVPEGVYIALLWIAAAAAVAMSLGVLTRAATVTTFALVTYTLFVSTTEFHNNRAYLVIVLAMLALAPVGREPVKPAWPLWLLRFECAAVYGASGMSKLLDGDWFSGTVTWMRCEASVDDYHSWHIPDWAISVLTDRDVHTVAAKFVIATELFIAAGLWRRGSRYAAVWVAVVFHVIIDLTASVQVFSLLAIPVLLVWAVPSTRDRVLRVDPASRLAAVVARLDWLARFRVEPAARGAPPEVVDRDGSVLRGGPAVVFTLSRLPLTAWFALPVRLAARQVSQRRGLSSKTVR